MKSLSKTHSKVARKQAAIDELYDRFKKGVREVKLSLDGKTELKDARTWLNELQD